MIQHTVLRDDTLLVRDGDSWIVYSPFVGRITRIQDFPVETSALEGELREAGFFASPPERVSADTIGTWRGFGSLTLLLTRCCNLACSYCYAKAKPTGASMPIELALGSLEWFAAQLDSSTMRISFHGGGEPTLQQETIRAVVHRARQIRGDRALKFQITTNGTTPAAFTNWMIEKRFHISISMDGPPDIQNRNRPFATGAGSSDVVEATVRHLVTARHPFTIRMTFSPVDDISRVIRYFADLGVRSLHLEPVFPFGREFSSVRFGRKSGDEVYAPIASEMVKNFLAAVDLCREVGIRIYNGHLIHFTKGVGYFCGAASGRAMMVTHDGMLTGCIEVVDRKDPNVKTFDLGRWIPEERRFDIDQQKLATLQSRHADALPECKTCYARYHCAGGCAVKAVRASGDFMERDLPYCGFTRALVPLIVKRIAAASAV